MSDLIEDRGNYGTPKVNHDRIAGMWSAYLGTEVTAHDCAVMMVLLKMSRAKSDPFHEDNYDDSVAYLQIARMVR